MTVLPFYLTSTAPVEVYSPKHVEHIGKSIHLEGKVCTDSTVILYPCKREEHNLSLQVEQEEVRVESSVDGETRTPRSKNKKRPQSSRSDVVDGLNQSYLDFPFLQDPFTIDYIRRSKTLFLMRGLSGSGKSTIVEAIQQLYSFAAVCSADHYFLRNGEYRFDATLLSSAHGSCQHAAKQAAEAGCPVIVVDNTNVKRWEMKYYLALAFRCSYVVIPVLPKTPWCFDLEELAQRNKHGVDIEILRKKVVSFDQVTPLYYGWFVNEGDSEELLFMAHKLYMEALAALPAFAQALLSQLRPDFQPDDPGAERQALAGYYTRSPERSNALLHCTAKFLGRGRGIQPGSRDYHGSALVQASVGRAFTLELYALSLTPTTLGARVRLTPGELPLYDKPEERDWGTWGQAQDLDCPQGWEKGGQGGGGGGIFGERGGERVMEVGFYGTEEKVRYAWRGRSAHLTLGCASGVEPRQTNFDVLRLCDEEVAAAASGRQDFVPMTLGRMHYYGNAQACIYLYNPISVKSMFSGLY